MHGTKSQTLRPSHNNGLCHLEWFRCSLISLTLRREKERERERTRRTRSRQRCFWTSRRRSSGNSWRMSSSLTPLVHNQLYWTNRLTRSCTFGGSCRWLIHSSVSLRFTLHSSSLAVEDCRNCCSNPQTTKIPNNFFSSNLHCAFF